MTSKNDKEKNQRAVTFASQMTLLLWGLLLLVNAIFETGLRSSYTLSSLTILLVGLVIFYVTYLISFYSSKREK